MLGGILPYIYPIGSLVSLAGVTRFARLLLGGQEAPAAELESVVSALQAIDRERLASILSGPGNHLFPNWAAFLKIVFDLKSGIWASYAHHLLHGGPRLMYMPIYGRI